MLTALGIGMVSALVDDGADTTAAASPATVTARSAEHERDLAANSVLGKLNAALTAGNAAAFDAAVDPSAPPSFRDHERTVFQGLTALKPYATFQYRWTSRSLTVPASGAASSADSFRAYIDLVYAFTGYDHSPVTDVVGVTFTRRNGTWYLSSDSELDDALALGGQFEPWSTGPVSVSQHGKALVIGDPAHKAQNDRLAQRLDDDLAPVGQAWPVNSWNGRVIAYASTQQPFVTSWFGTHAATNRKIDPSGDATFEAKVRVLPSSEVISGADTFTPAAPRLVVTPYLLGRDDAYTKAVLRHELTHVALALEGSRRPPAWLVEGVAEYTGFRATAGKKVDGVQALAQRGLRKDTWTQLRRGAWAPDLVASDDAFYSGSEIEVDNAYTSAWFTCLYIADHYGEAKLRELYAAAAAQPDGTSQESVETAALQSVLHTDRATLLTATKAYARQLRTHFV